MTTSAATPQGLYGCTLWLATHIPWATVDGEDFYPTTKSVFILEAKPRYLIALVGNAQYKFLAVVAHGPHIADVNPNAAELYWTHLAGRIASFRTKNRHYSPAHRRQRTIGR